MLAPAGSSEALLAPAINHSAVLLSEKLNEDPLAGAGLGPETANIEPENEALRREPDAKELEDARLTALSSACWVGVCGRVSPACH